MINDENLEPSAKLNAQDRPSDKDRARFGFKRPSNKAPFTGSQAIVGSSCPVATNLRLETNLETSTTTTASAISVDCTGSEFIDLQAIVSNTLGDLEPEVQRCLKLKPTAGKYDFKDRIADLESIIAPLKNVILEQRKRCRLLTDHLNAEQEKVNEHLRSSGVTASSQRGALEEARDEIGALRKETADRSASQRKLRADLEKANRELHPLREKTASESRRADSAEALLVQARLDIVTQSKRADDAEAQCEAASSECRQQINEASELLRSQVTTAAKDLRDHKAESQKREDNLVASIDEARSQIQGLERELQKVKTARDDLLQVRSALEGKVSSLETDLETQSSSFSSELKKKGKEMDDKETAFHTELESKISAFKVEIQQKEARYQSDLDFREAAHKSELESQAASFELQLRNSDSSRERNEAKLRQSQADDQLQHEKVIAEFKESMQQVDIQHKAEVAELQAHVEQQRAEMEQALETVKSQHQVQLEERERMYSQKLAQKEAENKEFLESMKVAHQTQLQEKESLLNQKDKYAKESLENTKQLHQTQIGNMEEMLQQKDELSSELLKQRDDMIEMLKRTHLQQMQQKEEVLQQKDGNLRESLQSMKLLQNSSAEQSQMDRQRIQRLEIELHNLRAVEEELRAGSVVTNQQAERLQTELSTANRDIADTKATLQRLEADKDHQLEKAFECQAALQEELRDSGLKHESLKEELTAVKLIASQKTTESETYKRERDCIEVEFRTHKEHHSSSNQQQVEAITDLKKIVNELSMKVDATNQEVQFHKANLNTQQGYVQNLERQLAAAECTRRELHNTIQELKGNIRVFCRVRPQLDGSDVALQKPEANKLVLGFGQEKYDFNFDRVFDAHSTQESIFDEVAGLVQSALDGYKVCLFAYGQTGSGKTFTMQGLQDPSSWGLIPRSLSKIFHVSESMRVAGWEWTLRASFLEVYNETLRDLLGDQKSESGSGLVHIIKHDDAWGTLVTNLTTVEVKSMDHIKRLMDKASRARAVGSTDMNAVSSRSHSVFALYLHGVNREIGSELHGALHLVDLAGSERLDRSGATGDRLKETQNINKSLSSLADVFLAKSENRSHIPFRNSKLTHLMEPCLNGQGKTLMVVNVGPEQENAHETLCSLRFAGQVSQCTTGGKPKRSARPAASATAAVATPARGQATLRPTTAGLGAGSASASRRK
eukprot:TRINITY_DN2964_c0_g1_i2.p1 TRINITY_DN2964_c0_g1~~TRINITY_DN2964_c0_g1_i2.p1  ORF type:complete len:1189 (-),score=319.24 TRINITY_DN2964_c0_g1_i2:408-3974(-)